MQSPNNCPTVSVVMPCFNERPYIENAVRSLLAQQEPPGGFEIIVVDGLSTDGTREILSRLAVEDSRLRVVDNPRGLTPYGMNIGVRAARGTYIAILGAHGRYAPDYVIRAWEVAQETGADNVGGTLVCEYKGWVQQAIAVAHHSFFSVGGARWHRPNYEGPADTVFGGFYKADVFQRVGYFDEELVRNQDDEWNLRLTRAGGRIWQSPKIKSWYHPRASLGALFRQYTQYGYWKVRVIQKHRLPASWRHLAPGMFLLALLLGAAAAPFSWYVLLLWAGLAGSYLSVNLAVSVLVAAKNSWRLLPVLPLVFACYHFGYGYGFMRGLVDFVLLKRSGREKFVAITRPVARKLTLLPPEIVKQVRKLLVLGRVAHYHHNGQFYAYTPYARELDVWAQLFPEVIIASTLREAPPPGDCSPFAQKNITVVPVLEAGGDSWKAKLRQVLLLPVLLWQLVGYLRQADAVHVRCPSDLGFLGIILGPLFSRRLVAKYATQWLPYPGEPRTWRLQSKLLKSRWWRGPATVYGCWPNQPRNIIPFFTSMLTEQQVARARSAAQGRRFSEPLRVLFVGRLTAGKKADVLLRALAAVGTTERTLECAIVGEGPERVALEKLAEDLGIRKRVAFTGGLSFEEVLGQYERSDILVLSSQVEGWPKVVAEAMAFGLVCIGSERGLLPQMLGEGRGILVKPGDVTDLTAALRRVINNPAESLQMAAQAAAWAQRYSLEGLRDALRQLLSRHWTPLIL